MIRTGDVVIFNHEKRHGWIVIHRTDPKRHKKRIAAYRENNSEYIPHIDVRLIRRDRAKGKWLYICMNTDHMLTVVGHDYGAKYKFNMLAPGINRNNILHWTGEPLRRRTKEQRNLHRKFEALSISNGRKVNG